MAYSGMLLTSIMMTRIMLSILFIVYQSILPSLMRSMRFYLYSFVFNHAAIHYKPDHMYLYQMHSMSFCFLRYPLCQPRRPAPEKTEAFHSANQIPQIR